MDTLSKKLIDRNVEALFRNEEKGMPCSYIVEISPEERKGLIRGQAVFIDQNQRVISMEEYPTKHGSCIGVVLEENQVRVIHRIVIKNGIHRMVIENENRTD